MDKPAFDRAREQFKKKTDNLSDEAVTKSVKALVEVVRSSPPPTRMILGVTFATSPETAVSKASSTLTY